ncbi:MAG: T9SS type A sorting domain-containing protein [bacterium]|nr:T9SS type A sorting domain-containing protein [bacterium]
MMFLRSFSLLVVLPLAICLSALAQPYWNGTNGPEGGDVNCFLAANGQLYAGTSGGGIYRSTDQGDHWGPFEFMGSTIHTMTVNDSGQIFVVLGGDGLFRYNADSTWTRAQQGILEPWIQQICFDPGTRNLYAQTAPGMNDVVCYRSANNGDSWTPINNGLSTEIAGGLSIAPNGDLYIGAFGGVYRSTNHGDNWTSVGSFQNDEISCFAFSGTTIYAGGTGVFQSTNNGQTWSELGNITDYLYTIATTPNGTLYIATSNGVYRLLNNQLFLSGLSNRGVSSLITIDNDVIFAGVFDIGVYRLQASNWNPVNNGLTCTSVHTIAFRGMDYYACSSGQVFQLAPATFRWVSRSAAVTHSVFRSMTIGSNGELLVGAYTGIIRSTNNGGEWSTIALDDEMVRSLACAPMSNVYAGTTNFLYRSTDNGLTWTQFTTRPTETITSIHVTPTLIPESWIVNIGTANGLYRMLEDGRNWTATGLTGNYIHEISMSSLGVLFAGTSQGVSRSLDQGLTWLPLPITLPTYSIVSNTQGRLYAATSNGVMYSTNGGSSWDDLSHEGLLNQNVFELKIDADNYLWAATNGNGVFVSFHPTNDVREPITFVPAELRLHQNYPNPFNATTTISYSLPTVSNVDLSIFDVNGRLVEQLLSGKQPAGLHSVNWQANNKASGRYFYRVMVNGQEQTRSLMLIK